MLPRGTRPYTIRGGALKGTKFYFDLQQDTQVWRGIYEQALQAWLAREVQPDAVCIDVGAAEGCATLLMARLAYQGHVHAFEPSERGAWIPKNLQLSADVALAEVNVHHVFVGAQSGTDGDGRRHLRLDDYVFNEQMERIDVVKIDVDGPELDVLDGAAELLARFRPAVCVEAHSHALCQGVVERLRSAGYAVRVVDPPPHEFRPLEYNPTVFTGSTSKRLRRT